MSRPLHRRGSRHPSIVALAGVIAAVALSNSVAFADDVADEADLQFHLAAESYQRADYRGALEHFLSSNRLAPNHNVLFNIARCYEALRNYPDAYRYYVRAAKGETDPAARGRIDDALKRMSANVAVLEVVTDPPGATLYLDRKDLGQRGAGPQTLGLARGTYTVLAEAPGYEEAVSPPTQVEPGVVTTVVLKLVRILGTVHVEGAGVQGAAVRLDSEDGDAGCIAPCDLQAPPGHHTTYVSLAGYKTAVVPTEVVARAGVTVHPILEPKTGSLVVSTDEPGAIVEVDGVARGPTPALLTLAVGKHDVRVTLRGFHPIQQKVAVGAGTETRLENLPLTPVEEVEAASRLSESVADAPASVSIISAHELRGMGYATVFQALQGVRGVYLSDDRGYDAAGFRGFGGLGDYGNRTLVLLNGQPMNDNWLWGSYLGYDLRTDLEDVERIEVIRGPGSVLYGTGAVSGVINIITRRPEDQKGFEVGASTADGTVARGRARAAVDFGEGARLWTSVQASHSSGNAYSFPAYASDPLTHGNIPASDDRFNAATWTGQFTWRALAVQWSLNTHNKHIPTGEFSTILGDDRTRQRDTRAMLEAKFEPKIGSNLQSFSRAHANYYGYDSYFAAIPELGGLSRETFAGVWAGVEERIVYAPSNAVRVTAGGELQNHFKADQFADMEYPTPTTYVNDHHSFQVGAAYAVADLTPAPALKISAGARYDAYSLFGGSFNPRLAAIVRPYDAGNVKVLFGKAFRAPSVYEMFWSQPGLQFAAPNLRPESMYSAEVEYSHRFPNAVVALASVYENVIVHVIALDPANDPSCSACVRYENTSTPVGTMGAEAEVRREWQAGWMASASYSFAHSVYLKDGSLSSVASLAHDPTRREVPNAPAHLASARASAPIFGRALAAMTRFSFMTGRYDVNDRQSTLANPTPPQSMTSAAVVWDLVLNGQEPRFHVRYSLGMYNLFGWKYSVPVSSEFTQPGGASLTSIVQNGRTVMAAAYFEF